MRLLDRYRPAIVEELRSVFDGRTLPPYSLMRYHLGWQDRDGRPIAGRPGKLLRPSLCLLCCEAVGGDWRTALPAAAALELLHNFTLIHDDVEDESAQRHGRDTLWSLWGQAQAINAGDGMFALAQVALLRLRGQRQPPARVLRASQMLAEATLRLCEGQQRDLAAANEREITPDDYLQTVDGKSAALLAASAGIGAVLGGAPAKTVAALAAFGRRLGFAFQIRDDVLGIWGDVAETGKSIDDDLRAGKRSYPVVIALASGAPEARAALQQLLARPERSDADIARVCSLLDEVGAREESERAARDHAEAAVASLAGLSLRPRRAQELGRLAHFAARRRA